MVAERMTHVELTEASDHWSVNCAGSSVTRIAIDWAVTLTIASADNGFEIRIESPLTLRTPEEQVIHLDPEGNPFGLAAILGLVRQDVERIDAFKDGHLEIELSNGSSVSVALADDFEPWEIIGQDGMRIVSVPGGTISVWRNEADQQ